MNILHEMHCKFIFWSRNKLVRLLFIFYIIFFVMQIFIFVLLSSCKYFVIILSKVECLLMLFSFLGALGRLAKRLCKSR
jgi:hypothetical protein